MKKIYHLRKNKEFNYVYRRGKSFATPYMVLIYARNGNNNVKIGFSVSKKIGKSVIRNRVKRRMKENFRVILDQVKTGYNIVIVARKPIVDLSFHDIRKTMMYLLKKSKLFMENRQENEKEEKE